MRESSNTLILGILPNGNSQSLSLDTNGKLRIINVEIIVTFDQANITFDQASVKFDGN